MIAISRRGSMRASAPAGKKLKAAPGDVESNRACEPFRYFNSSSEVVRPVVMMYVRFPFSLRNVEDLLFDRAIDICHETVRDWWRNGQGLVEKLSWMTSWISPLPSVGFSIDYAFSTQ
jgi:hypothetical protein